ncbi:hypothetical protein GGR57DRAFT_186942 [Xylariaceae sp. FL1272]|nr:hypothetical protein GGR57DRAFT_186942 [Xylariaceae sp. FL1272]
MVYCGKPSRGCQMCRTRRIKCDETKPTCQQCAKSRRQCPGYKDEFDLVLRNETTATERRAKKANKKALAQKQEKQEESSRDFSSRSHEEAESSQLQMARPSLEIPTETHASNHFIANFIVLPQQGRMYGHMDFVLPLLRQEGPDSHIQHAFNACAMAFFHNRRGTNGKLSEIAFREYSAALTRTNAALRDVESQQSDATLGAVLLLGMFENISAKQIGAFHWGSHVDGAVQLVKARGKKLLKSEVGKSLFIAVRTLMSVYCLTAEKAPVMGAEWWVGDTFFSQPAATIQQLMIKTSEIRAEVGHRMDKIARTPDHIELMLELIRKIQSLDLEVSTWQRDVPENWRYRTIGWEDNVPNGDYARAEVFPGRVDVYENIWIASCSNTARTIRLILASLVVRCAAWICSPLDYRTTPEYATATNTCRDAITDMIASVPYHFAWHLRKQDSRARPVFGDFPCGDQYAAKGLAGYLLTWHLTCAVTQDYVTDTQRAWMLGRMKSIGYDMGVKYALVLCQLPIRVPSMLIRRDGLMQAQHGMAVNFEKLVGDKVAAPTAGGYALTPQQQWEALQIMKLEQGKDELINKASGNASGDTRTAAQKWLRIE